MIICVNFRTDFSEIIAKLVNSYYTKAFLHASPYPSVDLHVYKPTQNFGKTITALLMTQNNVNSWLLLYLFYASYYIWNTPRTVVVVITAASSIMRLLVDK